MKILIVEDDKDLCDLLYDIIRDEGFRVHKVYDGDAALKSMLRNEYDIMIVDNKLSVMSGITVIEQSMAINPRLKTIILSAYGNTPTKLRARDLGVYDFIDKPFDVNFLLKRVKELVELPGNCPSLIFA